jgi:predicted HTH transcriptional regulator
LEFKPVPNEDLTRYLKTVVAFANGRGGRILFGVGNDGKVVGMSDEQLFQHMDTITDFIANGCAPRIPMSVGIERIDGKAVIALDVFAGTRCPYYLKSEGERDGVYLRIGATTRQADDAARHDLYMESAGRSFDREPCPNAKIDAERVKRLCSKMHGIALRNCRDGAERRSVRRVTESQLESWGIISRANGKWVASNAYALLTGDRAFPIRVRCGVFKGDDKAVFVDRREFAGGLCDLIEKAHEYILSKINMGMEIAGVQRRDVYELPPDELRELVINAFAHRNYFDHEAPVFVAVYDTRVEITSPGGMPRGLTVEKAMIGCSKIRNRAIAAALTYMRYVEGWGSGLLRVSSALKKNGLAPLEVADDGVDVRVNVRRRVAAASRGEGGQAGERTINRTTNRTIKRTTKEAVLDAIKANPGISRTDLMLITGKGKTVVAEVLASLREEGEIEHRGSKKTGGYYPKVP